MLIDLKIGAVKHRDIGQMNMYLGYFAKEELEESDNPPIGIILAREKDELMVEYGHIWDGPQFVRLEILVVFARKFPRLFLLQETNLDAMSLKLKTQNLDAVSLNLSTVSYVTTMNQTYPVNLTWSHYRTLLQVDDEEVRDWYAKEASREGWSVRTLQCKEIERQKKFYMLQKEESE